MPVQDSTHPTRRAQGCRVECARHLARRSRGADCGKASLTAAHSRATVHHIDRSCYHVLTFTRHMYNVYRSVTSYMPYSSAPYQTNGAVVRQMYVQHSAKALASCEWRCAFQKNSVYMHMSSCPCTCTTTTTCRALRSARWRARGRDADGRVSGG